MNIEILFLLLLFLIAALYASVGHGGASGYLALMALFGFLPETMKPTALLLNLFVSGISFYRFAREGYFQWNLFWPFALLSIPLSFLGGTIQLNAALYKQILGGLLLLPVLRFVFFKASGISQQRKASLSLSLLIGAAIGFLSGLIGIGGGIILSPVILMLGWADQKQTATISALFIFLNSVAGLGGQAASGMTFSSEMWVYVLVAFLGGSSGAYIGAIRFNQVALKRMLTFVLFVAAVKLLVF
ncbi:MAG: sulfite exporter TauE/SafE family protein [Chitinophagaceae bacterium]